METIGKLLVYAITFFCLALFSTIIGMLIGWIVGWLFGETILAFLACFGISGFKMWQISACLGFIGSFFGRNISVKLRN